MTLLEETNTLKKTPLYGRHEALGGKIVNFSGWALPVYYTGIIAEHLWTRESVSIFDVSHLGEIRVQGPKASLFLQRRFTNDLRKLADGKMQYSLLCDENGLTLDDILIYQEAPDDFYLIVNASNIENDLAALRKHAKEGVTLTDRSSDTACVAIQGPKSEAAIKTALGLDLRSLQYYHFRAERYAGEPVWISRSGYTGEDGFEIFSTNALAPVIWDALLQKGAAAGAKPAGLGARNTLRLEAGNPLYGHEIDVTTTPLDAGMQWAVSFEKGDFIGREALEKQKTEGVKRRLAGFRMLDRSIAREHYRIFSGGKPVGSVTSGSFGPSAGCNIGMGYVQKGLETPGAKIEIEVHGRLAPAEVVKLPFIPMKHKKG